ncbi:alpha/beta hydrolase [Chryseobacterium populi]|nr:alpha/beta hydrolase-fold protein [Chryseobacterium populi]
MLCVLVFSQQNVDKKKIFSKVLNEEREIWISVPKSYHSSDISKAKYPVIYLLDAEINFDYVEPMLKYLARNPYPDMPECILVGITNTDRTRDMTPSKSSTKSPVNPTEILFENSGGAENFAAFIQTELKSFIQNNYRTENYSILLGHSFGGLFTINTLVEHPDYFNAYIANDPSLWWDKQIVNEKMRKALKDGKFSKAKFLYLSEADNKDNKSWNSDMIDGIQNFKTILSSQDKINYKHQFYEDEMHGTVSYPGNYNGLRFIFKGYRTDIKKLSKNPQLLETEYKAFSEKMGYQFLPSEEYLNFIINFMDKNKFEESKLYFEKFKLKIYQNSL